MFCREECAELVIPAHNREYRLSERDCPAADCPLYPYREGRNPNRKGVGGRPKSGSG
jgi:hypothetical protein